MIAESLEQTMAAAVAARARWSQSRDRRGAGFWLGLACALAVHSLVLIGVAVSPARIIGEPDGSRETIDVNFIDEAELRGQGATPSQPQPDAAVPAPAAQPAPAPAAAEPEPEPAPSTPEPATLPRDLNVLTSPVGTPEIVAPRPPSAQPTPPPPRPKAPAAAAKQPAPPQPKTAGQMDLSVPRSLLEAPPTGAGRSAAVSRPPGITRSGENDDFARGVIRALRQTMPPPSGLFGRVTIRILLSQSGNVVEVALMSSSRHPSLDQSVVFAARQSSFPIPPKGATLADLQFLVTYIYN